jgi:phosphatidate cytidylyltransferase
VGCVIALTTLTKRIITAIVLVAVLIGTLFFLPPIASVFLLGFFLLQGSWEWSGFVTAKRPSVRLLYVLMLVVFAAGISFGLREGLLNDSILVVAVIWWLLVAMWLIARGSALAAGACALAGVMAFLPGWYAVGRLFGAANGAWLFIWLVAIVAAADIGAYFVGKSLGRHKLAPHISPGKTREGLVGGVLCAALVAAAGAKLAGAAVLLYTGVGLAVALISVVGDLTVSMFKRQAGLKDSGRILPGHGGVMDRIDGLIAALPLFVLLLSVTGMLVENTTT